ncbi:MULTISPECIES: hypothetical protein [Sphingobacterium]|uniref:hypothetical protein n=1 Tax=Sphingobacterium TaxID=28453 RepID=UPI0013DD31C8|nr:MULTISPECIES: hypothetical protein [unclassified Sphingobacterium]
MTTHYKLTIYERLEGKLKEEYLLTSEEISINPIHFLPTEKDKQSPNHSISSRYNKLITQMKEEQTSVLL